MPAPTVPGPLDGADFRGKVSTPPTNREAEPRECLHCGSQLAGRYQGVRFIGGTAQRVWTCPCGHDRWIPMEVAA
jgi:hypothetical protein